ncbi:uncharacterized protein LOC132619936 [Lycium barbarum]|uniref:uncharacterized protein LOC132619936 n=1 Tax=Lycium barbarum TaxID=112863 RepID=UPI00293F298E|nr:uncharacterized protein LOC132619936 [Lycium barbarum]
MLDEKFKDFHNNPSIAEDDDYKAKIAADINKIDEYYAVKPYQRMIYYPRPTPQDVLIKEEQQVNNTSYSGKEIYEWNIDGYSERQIYCTVHRMLMYSTINKVNKNSERTIADMIIASFTGQLKGWWDNYLTQDQRGSILNVVKREPGENQEIILVSTAVYTLVLNIIEHFSGRWSYNNETIRRLLQNLRYGLPAFLAERVRKALRKGETSINYSNYTYGSLIGTCMQEGLALCNEIKPNQQIKKHGLTERQQLGEFCGQFGLQMPQTKKPHRHKKRKYFQAWKEKRLKKKSKRKKDFKQRKDFIKSKNPKACYKCGRVGHFYKD